MLLLFGILVYCGNMTSIFPKNANARESIAEDWQLSKPGAKAQNCQIFEQSYVLQEEWNILEIGF